jgi:hypothetical protein
VPITKVWHVDLRVLLVFVVVIPSSSSSSYSSNLLFFVVVTRCVRVLSGVFPFKLSSKSNN